MILNHANRFGKLAAAKKMEDPDSPPQVDVVSSKVLDRKQTRVASRRRAKKMSHKAAIAASSAGYESKKPNASVASQSALAAEASHVSTTSSMPEISLDANDGGWTVAPCAKESCITLPSLRVEANNSQIDTADGALEVQKSSTLAQSEMETRKLLPKTTATDMLKPRTQADKDLLKFEKKLREVESLKQRLAAGHELQQKQLDKMALEADFRRQVLALTEADSEHQSGCCESSSSEESLTCASGKEISDDMDGSSTRSSDDVQAGYRLDWNDPSWESSEPPCLRFNSLPEADEEEEEEEEEEKGTAAVPGVPVCQGSVFMPVGFLNHNQEYFPFMELPAEQTDVFLEPAILQKIVRYDSTECQSERMLNEPQIKEPYHAWSPVSSHADWEGLGEKRGVQPSYSGNSWSSSFSRDWETSNRSTRHQFYEESVASPCNSWENQVQRWDEPWGM